MYRTCCHLRNKEDYCGGIARTWFVAACLRHWSYLRKRVLESAPIQNCSSSRWQTSLSPTTTPSGCCPSGERCQGILNLNSEFRRSLRRIKPEKRKRPLSARPASDLLYLADINKPIPKLLLDTTVYIDVLQGRMPADADAVLATAGLWHSTVTEAEMAAACGFLDPEHPHTSRVIEQITISVEKRPQPRILAPDRGVWREAGMLSGLLARLQGYDSNHRRQVLNDALIFCSALKHGCTVLTRNTRDFDLLQQVMPAGRVLFYKQT